MILVTGASGQLASRILHHLQRLDAPAVGASRTPQPGYRVMDFDQPDTIDLAGIDTLVLVSAGYAEDDVVLRRHQVVIEAASRQQIGHLVYTSLVTDGDHLGFALAHRATERLLTDSDLPHTILRNGLYAELVGALLSWDGDILESPFGNRGVAAPTRDDLAHAAAIVAAHPARHEGQCYDLTGVPFTVHDIATTLAVGLRDIDLGEYRRRLLTQPDLLAFQPPMLTSIASSIRHGFLERHTPNLAELLGTLPAPGLSAATTAAKSNRP